MDKVFKIVADPTRRAILDLLIRSDRSVREINAAFPISQPAVSQHLRALRAVRLVAATRVGQEQRYRLTGGPLREVYEWAGQFQKFFDPAGHAWAFTKAERRGKN